MSRRSWAKLMTDWHEDRVLVAVAAEHGPRVYAYFAVMIAECKRRLNNGGDGVWEVSDAAFAAATGDIKGRRKTRLLVLQAMHDAGLIVFQLCASDVRAVRYSCTPRALTRYQSGTTSTARVQKHRATKPQTDDCNALHGTRETRGNGLETETETETEKQQGITPIDRGPFSVRPSFQIRDTEQTDNTMTIDEFCTSFVTLFSPLLTGDMRVVAETQLWPKTRVVHWETKKRYSLTVWLKACEMTADRIRKGGFNDPKKLVGYILKVVDSCDMPDIELKDGVGDDRPLWERDPEAFEEWLVNYDPDADDSVGAA